MASPTDDLAQALADVERIARGYYEEADRIYCEIHGTAAHPLARWESLTEREREIYRECTRRLLRNDVIRVGQRPSVERPIEGQTTIDSLPLDG